MGKVALVNFIYMLKSTFPRIKHDIKRMDVFCHSVSILKIYAWCALNNFLDKHNYYQIWLWISYSSATGRLLVLKHITPDHLLPPHWAYFGFSMVTRPPPPPQRFLWNAITRKIFYFGLSNLVWGYIRGMALSLSFGGLGLQAIGQWRPLKGQNLGFWTHFGKVLK